MLWTAIVDGLRSSRHSNICLCGNASSNSGFFIHKLAEVSLSDKLFKDCFLCIFLVILAFWSTEVPKSKHFLQLFFIDFLRLNNPLSLCLALFLFIYPFLPVSVSVSGPAPLLLPPLLLALFGWPRVRRPRARGRTWSVGGSEALAASFLLESDHLVTRHSCPWWRRSFLFFILSITWPWPVSLFFLAIIWIPGIFSLMTLFMLSIFLIIIRIPWRWPVPMLFMSTATTRRTRSGTLVLTHY